MFSLYTNTQAATLIQAQHKACPHNVSYVLKLQRCFSEGHTSGEYTMFPITTEDSFLIISWRWPWWVACSRNVGHILQLVIGCYHCENSDYDCVKAPGMLWRDLLYAVANCCQRCKSYMYAVTYCMCFLKEAGTPQSPHRDPVHQNIMALPFLTCLTFQQGLKGTIWIISSVLAQWISFCCEVTKLWLK